MKKIVLSLVLMTITTLMFAKKGPQDVVYLKNGAIVHGDIIEQIPNTSIKIQTEDGNVTFYSTDDIEQVAKESGPTNLDAQTNVAVASGFEKGNQLIVEAGFGFPYDNPGKTLAKFEFINGYRFNPYFALGVGFGIRSVVIDEANEFLAVPVFLDLRANVSDQVVSPYFSLGVGYSQALQENCSGALFKTALGVSIGSRGKSSLNIGLCLDLQSMKVARLSPQSFGYGNSVSFSSTGTSEFFSSLGANIGFSF